MVNIISKASANFTVLSNYNRILKGIKVTQAFVLSFGVFLVSHSWIPLSAHPATIFSVFFCLDMTEVVPAAPHLCNRWPPHISAEVQPEKKRSWKRTILTHPHSWMSPTICCMKMCKALKQSKVSTLISIATQKYVAISFANNSVSYCSDLWIAGKGFTV